MFVCNFALTRIYGQDRNGEPQEQEEKEKFWKSAARAWRDPLQQGLKRPSPNGPSVRQGKHTPRERAAQGVKAVVKSMQRN